MATELTHKEQIELLEDRIAGLETELEEARELNRAMRARVEQLEDASLVPGLERKLRATQKALKRNG